MRDSDRGWIPIILPVSTILLVFAGMVLFVIIFLSGCGRSGGSSRAKVDSAYASLFDGLISDGIVEVPSDLPAKNVPDFIRAQLNFSMGQLAPLHAAPDTGRIQVDVVEDRQVADSSEWRLVHYRAIILIAWESGVKPPAMLQFVLPARIDLEDPDLGERFHSAFADSCGTSDLDASVMWHDFSPALKSCPLRPLTLSESRQSEIVMMEKQQVARVFVEIQPSSRKTSDRRPEYDMIWDDGRLKVTALFGKDDAEADSDSDEGTREFINTYHGLLERYGAALESNLLPGQEPGTKVPYVQMRFQEGAKRVEVTMILTDRVGPVDDLLNELFSKSAPDSDLVIYSGHSGYGARLEALVGLAAPQAKQYQIWLVDSCSSYSYLDDALGRRFRMANPKDHTYKYLDIIANAMPAPWGVGRSNNLAIIEALMDGRKSYREILTDLDKSSMGVVWGEEDNSE